MQTDALSWHFPTHTGGAHLTHISHVYSSYHKEEVMPDGVSGGDGQDEYLDGQGQDDSGDDGQGQQQSRGKLDFRIFHRLGPPML